MNTKKDPSVLLPNGEHFISWEIALHFDRELHVDQNAANASDDNDGSEQHPFRTINAAARIATPGTRILVYPGIYREQVVPAKGGESTERMISYEANGPLGSVVVSGSVIAKNVQPSVGWQCMGDDAKIYMTRLDPADFVGYNPFCNNNVIHFRTYLDLTRDNRTSFLNRRGVVFVDGCPLKQVETYGQLEEMPGSYWVESNGMVVHFRLSDDGDARAHLIELTSKEQNFAPEAHYLCYIRVKGFTFTHAATGHPFPQRGSLSCSRGHHWIIEDNTIAWSNSLGIDVGSEDPSVDHPEGMACGHTIIRRNDILNCGVCGIAGLSADELLVEDNKISGCGWLLTWHCSESGGIKFHYATNCLIRRNIVEKLYCGDAIWLDCNNDNNRITQNLVCNNDSPDPRIIHIENTRSQTNLVDNNIIWDCRSSTPSPVFNWGEREEDSMTGAIMGMGTDQIWASHNLIGKCTIGVNLQTIPFRYGYGRGGTARENHIYNNIFYDCRDAAIRFEDEHNSTDGNVFAMMPPGYLRLRYPLPEKLLNLQAWQDFYGYDKASVEAQFEIELDEETYMLRFLPAKPRRYTYRDSLRLPPDSSAKGIGAIEPVVSDGMIISDYFGNQRGEQVFPGPFCEPQEGLEISVDPRMQ